MARTKRTAYRSASPPRPYRCLLEPGQDGPAAPAPLLQLGSGGSEIIACLPHNGTNMFSFYIMSMATGKSYAYPLYSRDWFLPNPVIWTEEDRLKLSATRQPVFWRDEVAKLGYSRDGGFASVVRVYEQGKGWMRMKKSRAYKDMTEGWDKKGPAVEAYAQRSLVELSQYEQQQQQQQQQQPKQGGAYATFTSFYKGDITLKGVLGQGAYGTVRHGEIRSTGYQVAVKFWDRQEDRSACLHANLGMLVVEPTPTLLRPLGILRGSGIAEGLVFPAFGSGTTLDDLWNLRYDGGDGREEQVPLRTLLAAVVPVVEAVACMHRAGMIHRDIKPANIAVAPGADGHVLAVLLDFDLACRDGVEKGLAGTEAFKPEEGDLEDGSVFHTKQFDMYSLGAMIYALLLDTAEEEEMRQLVRCIANRAKKQKALEKFDARYIEANVARPDNPPPASLRKLLEISAAFMAEAPEDRPVASTDTLMTFSRLISGVIGDARTDYPSAALPTSAGNAAGAASPRPSAPVGAAAGAAGTSATVPAGVARTSGGAAGAVVNSAGAGRSRDMDTNSGDDDVVMLDSV